MLPFRFSKSDVVTAIVLGVLVLITVGVWVQAFHNDAPTVTVAAPVETPTPSPTQSGLLAPDGSLAVAWIGTVLTAGKGASDVDHTFQSLVDKALNVDHAVTSTTTLGRLTSPDALTAALKDVAASDLYLVELGEYLNPELNPSTFGDRLRDVLQQVRATAPDAVVLCVGQWASLDTAKPFDQAARKACRRSDGTFVGVSDLFEQDGSTGAKGRAIYSGHPDKPDTTSTATDPTDDGSTRIADRILETLGVAPA